MNKKILLVSGIISFAYIGSGALLFYQEGGPGISWIPNILQWPFAISGAFGFFESSTAALFVLFIEFLLIWLLLFFIFSLFNFITKEIKRPNST